MSEQSTCDYGAANLEKFLQSPGISTRLPEYKRRGLIPTNNFKELFQVSSLEEALPGKPHHYDYRERPFGDIIQKYIDDNPETIEDARELTASSKAIHHAYAAMVFAGKGDEPAAQTLRTHAEIAYWMEAGMYTGIFHDVAPAIAAAGFDPIEACI